MNNKAFLIGNEIYLIGGNENYNFEIIPLTVNNNIKKSQIIQLILINLHNYYKNNSLNIMN